ncbi:MAG: sugar ABC transporter permease [Oscillospiraceae bacterium]|jgi:multiple sugar transport system permease protein|nr:sugar ABC transporter permease [Oscillospiraceae bacterium]
MTLQKKKSISYAKYGYLFSLPFVIAYLVFHLYPTVYTAILGFTDCKGLGNTNWHFLKDDIWKNFRTILNNATFKTSLKNTVVLWIMNFFPQITLALLLTAWFTSKRNTIKGQGFFKVVFYMPNIITAASVAILFNVLFGYPKGPVNDILVSLGLRSEAFFFTNSATASRWIIAFIQFWMWYGYTMIILISGVLGINPEIYEAAEIDGANDWQTFWQITIPNLRTILTYTLITSMIGGLNMYDMSKMFNNGNPNNSTLTTSVFIYNQAFAGSYMYNRAAAASMIMFVIIAFFSIIVFYLMRDRKS